MSNPIDLKKIALTGGIWSLFSTGVSTLLSLGSTLLLARLLTPSDFGTFAISAIVINIFLGFTGMGIGLALVQNQHLTNEEISSAFWLTIFTNLSIFAIIATTSPLIAVFLNQPILYKLLPFTALFYLVSTAGNLYSFLLEKELAFVLLAKQEVVAEIISVAATIFLAYKNLGVWSLAWGYLIHYAILSALYFYAGWSRWRIQLHFSWADIQKFQRFGLYQMGESALFNLCSHLDKILIGWLLGVQALGIYELAVNRLLNPLGTISMVLLRNSFPFFAKLQYDKPLLKNSYTSLIKILNTIDAPLIIGTAAIAPALIPVCFGDDWLQTVPLLPLLAVAHLFKRMNNQTGTLLLATGKPDLSFRWNFILLLGSSTAIIPASIYTGISGVASAVLLTAIISSIVGYFFLIKPILGECGMTLIADTVVPIFLSGLIGILMKTFSMNYSSSATWLAFTCIVGITLYLLFTWMFHRSFPIIKPSPSKA